jgi:hypothetical protein
MGTTYEGNVSDLWKAWNEEGVDVITKCGEHLKKWRATWTAAEVNQYNRLRFIITFSNRWVEIWTYLLQR